MGHILVTGVVPKLPPRKSGFPGGTVFTEPQEFTDSDSEGAIFLCMTEGRQGGRGKTTQRSKSARFCCELLWDGTVPPTHKSSVKPMQVNFVREGWIPSPGWAWVSTYEEWIVRHAVHQWLIHSLTTYCIHTVRQEQGIDMLEFFACSEIHLTIFTMFTILKCTIWCIMHIYTVV